MDDRYGTPYVTVEELVRACDHGLLSPEEARAIMYFQFPLLQKIDGYKVPPVATNEAANSPG